MKEAKCTHEVKDPSQAKDENEYTGLSIKSRWTFMFSMEEWVVHQEEGMEK